MSGPFSQVVSGNIVTIASGTPTSFGNLLGSWAGGSIISLTVSTWGTTAYVLGTNVSIWLGNSGAPTNRIYWQHDIQGGSPWVATNIRYDGLHCDGVEIVSGQTYLWAVVQGIPTMNVIITLVVSPP